MSEILSDTENQNDVLSYFPLDESTGKAKCKLCSKTFTHPINDLIARNHFSKSHKEEWDALDKDNDNKSTKFKNPKSIKDKPKVDILMSDGNELRARKVVITRNLD
ncbi:3292_t:CDS:2 [Cetraspora pellucida]|uniref:3292_t:CDS:1 n=1 Tax=Cetraspora pellucida TaxID=1433469 RepID=A0A9N9ILK6_9GLOM|nr:3292_t:CDS:2 [Cetraspora pellucida]